MNDLDWLTRNVHVWPHTADYLVRVGSEGYTFREHCEGETIGAMWFTRDQWLARRAELQNKPSWDDAPEWAEWLAQDGVTGYWWFYHDRPKPALCAAWDTNVFGEFTQSNLGEVLGDWRDTLERRPQAAKPEPSSDDWYKRGELPPVGLPVQLWFGGSYVYECEFIAERGNNLILWNLTWDRPDAADKWMCQFRPLPTERERVASELVDVMMAVPARDSETTSEHHMRVALAVYDHLSK